MHVLLCKILLVESFAKIERALVQYESVMSVKRRISRGESEAKGRDANRLHCKYYFTLSFTFLDDLIQSNCLYFVRKFMVSVLIDSFIGILTVFVFRSQAVFQYV